MDKEQRTKGKGSIIWAALAPAAAAAAYFFGLGSIPLLGPDEPRYAQVAREMFERGDWVTPTLGGFPWFEKPSLLYWLQIASYKLFGVSEFSARLGPALFGLLTVATLYLLGRFATAKTPGGGRREGDKTAGGGGGVSRTANCRSRTAANCDFADWLFLTAASAAGLLVFSRGASFDIVLTFPVTASLAAFFVFDRRAEESSSGIPVSAVARFAPLVAFYLFIGLALLAKGLVGIVFPMAIVFFYFVLSRRLPSRAFVFSLFWGTALSLLVASLWYAPMYARHGWAFVDDFFLQHHFARYTSNKYQHPQPFYYFFLVLPLMTTPWLPFFAAGVWGGVKDIFYRRRAQSPLEAESPMENEGGESGRRTRTLTQASDRRSALSVFALAWLVVPLVFFSFSGSKLAGYILPALPAAMIFAALGVSRFVRGDRRRRAALQVAAAATFAGAAVFLQFFAKDFVRHETVKDLIAAADDRGFSGAKIMNLSITSHNAEFYGAGRVVRTTDGKIRHFWNAVDVAEGIRREAGGKAVLILVPFQYEYQVPEGGVLDYERIGDNGEVAIYAVNLKGKREPAGAAN